jgi:hypothetical protein
VTSDKHRKPRFRSRDKSGGISRLFWRISAGSMSIGTGTQWELQQSSWRKSFFLKNMRRFFFRGLNNYCASRMARLAKMNILGKPAPDSVAMRE